MTAPERIWLTANEDDDEQWSWCAVPSEDTDIEYVRRPSVPASAPTGEATCVHCGETEAQHGTDKVSQQPRRVCRDELRYFRAAPRPPSTEAPQSIEKLLDYYDRLEVLAALMMEKGASDDVYQANERAINAARAALLAHVAAKDEEIERLREALGGMEGDVADVREAAGSLEAELRDRHGYPDVHPSQRWKFDRDIEDVTKLRDLASRISQSLQQKEGKNG